MNKILIFLFILLILYLLSKKNKKKIYENLEVENSLTREWHDSNEQCLKKNNHNCEENLDCIWDNNLDNCISRNSKACETYNNNYLDSNPYQKKIHCQKMGCNLINLENGKTKCVNNIYNNHHEYCQDVFNKNECVNKNECKWVNLKCIPKNMNYNSICKKLNTPEFLLTNLCKKENNKNNQNCYVEVQRDVNDKIIPFTGITEFKKRKCQEEGCKTINIKNNDQNLCVSKDFKNEEDVCLNYYKDEKVSFSKCKEIGCNYYPNLNKEFNGICFSKELSNKNNNSINTKILCNSIKNSRFCNDIGCTFENSKCKN
jgi:hypothetical protein